ncbi:RCC1 domain-containing protein [Bifidobacterium mizhiense]|uniref:RCC1 domain-containing protein n=1 Tax=Bifidobacterium mizhiense TaxID=2879940 RepID=UPI001E3526DF|nr:InlB B-repeat-containing protein [Bifidobacterium mizhiense]
MKTGTLAAPPQHNPQREGFRFDGWTLDGQPFDFQTPILQDTSLKAQWTKITDWTLSPDHGPTTGARLTISPPNKQEPYYTSIQAAGDQFVGLTGEGRIYTWTQDNTPKQVPFPTQAEDGFHYLQAAAGSRWQSALGSDQQIYTWAWGQATPTILDTGRNTQFTSLSMNDNRLLAVDQQGQIHPYQASQDPKPAEQATTSLPGKAQAVLAVASGSRILALDSDGQAWTRDASNTGNAKPERLTQNPHTHIIQAQALNQGALLLDTDGQAWYLADSTADSAAVSLPDGMKASRITANDSLAIITGKDGRTWAWQPGSKPTRTDNGSRQYMQAAKTGSRITAINRQGDMFAWSLDGQGQPGGKPTRLDTAQAPTLESASMDRQPLKLTKNNGSWHADMPAHKPGPAAITINGRQDGQTFTRSLTYTVDQPLARGAEPRSTLTVRFDTGGGNPVPAEQSFSTINGRVKRPSPDPAREGFLFDGWFIGQVAYDFSKPVDKNLTLTAKWTESHNNKWSISPDKGSQLGRESTTITPPDSISGIKFSQVSGGGNHSLAVGSDGNVWAWGDNTYGQLGDGTTTTRTTPVKVRTPDRKTYPDLPEDFTYVQVSGGWFHSLALGSDGYAYAWGRNDHGQLGNNTTSDSDANSVPVRVRDPASPTDASKGLKAAQVSAGYWHSLAVGSDGYAYAWGYNTLGQLGNNNTSNLSFPVRVRDPASPTDASKGLKAAQVSGGGLHSVAVGSDGYAYAWGRNTFGQLGNNTSAISSTYPVHVRDPASPTDASKGLQVAQVSAGTDYSLAVGNDGYAYAWGYNYYGQLGNNTTSSKFDGNHIPVHVCDPSSPTAKGKGLKALQVSAGDYHSVAVGSDGYVYTWGANDYGQLGNDSTAKKKLVPARVRDPSNPTDTSQGLQAVQVSGGLYHSLAIGTDGVTKAWGYNSCGQLGDDTKNDKSAPVPVSFNLQLVITGVRFDQTAVSGLTRGDGGSVSVLTPAHQPGTVTVSVDYTLGGAPQTPDTSLRYTYLPAGVLPKAGGEGILLALATGMTGMGGVLASRRHRKEQRQLLHASLE